MRFFLKVFNFFCTVVAAFWTFGCAIFATAGFFLVPSWGHAVQRTWGKIFLRLMGIRVRFQGLERLPKNGGYILAPNHESIMDIMVMASIPVDFKWVAKTQVAKIPLIGPVLRTMGSYLVRRDQSGHDLNVMKEVEDGLKRGQAVLIFPEGTRTRDGSLLPLKKGAFRVAQNTGVPLVPIAISGTFFIAPPGHVIPPGRRHDVLVKIGDPVFPAANADLSTIMKVFRQALIGLISAPGKLSGESGLTR